MALPIHEVYRRDIAERGFEIPDPLPDYLNGIGEEKFLGRRQEIRLSRQAKLERAEDDAARLRAARGGGTRHARPGSVSGRHRDGWPADSSTWSWALSLCPSRLLPAGHDGC